MNRYEEQIAERASALRSGIEIMKESLGKVFVEGEGRDAVLGTLDTFNSLVEDIIDATAFNMAYHEQELEGFPEDKTEDEICEELEEAVLKSKESAFQMYQLLQMITEGDEASMEAIMMALDGGRTLQ